MGQRSPQVNLGRRVQSTGSIPMATVSFQGEPFSLASEESWARIFSITASPFTGFWSSRQTMAGHDHE